MSTPPDYWQPITFQDVEFPRSLMAIDVIEPILALKDEALGAWLWKLTICRGVIKSAPATDCEHFARQVLDLLMDNKPLLLAGIEERLQPDGFDPHITFVEWLISMQKIAELSSKTYGDCQWFASIADQAKVRKSAKQFLAWMDDYRKRHS